MGGGQLGRSPSPGAHLPNDVKLFRSIRTRFALGSAVLVVGLLAAFGVMFYVFLSRSLAGELDLSLADSAARTGAGLQVVSGTIVPPVPGKPADMYEEGGPTVIVLSATGQVLEVDGSFSQVSLPPRGTGAAGSFVTLSLPGASAPLRVYSLAVVRGGEVVGWVQALQSLGPLQQTLHVVLLVLLLGGLLLAAVAGFGSFVLAGRALAPVDAIARTATRISSQDLSARLVIPDTHDELSRLASTFNDMLARLERSFQRERQFTADASHELRTPLAAMQAILTVMRQGEHPAGEYRASLDDLASETERLQTLVEDLLRLARSENGGARRLEPLDLTVLLSDVVETLRPLAVSKGLALECDLSPSLPFTADPDALIRLFVNLIDNAIKYTFAGSVTVTARCIDDTICVEVADTGIGIPPEHLPYIFERFYRVEAGRAAGGAGLGLAISRQLARSAGGRIEVRSTPGIGSTFTVYFPD